MIILQPKYIDEFKCDGSKCNAKCCGTNWRIAIDMDTYKKYQRIKNPAMRKKILSCLEPDAGGQGFQIKLQSDRTCPLVCEDNLCYIQRHMGEAALSITCMCYPRNVKHIGGYQFRTLSMTCPLAAEQALFSADGMIMQQSVSKDDALAWHLAAVHGEKKQISDDLLAVHIIMGGLAILQNNHYSMEQRLVLLGLFMDKLDAGERDAESVSELIEYYNGEKFHQEISNLWNNWRFYPTAHRQMLEGILNVLGKEKKLDLIAPFLFMDYNYDKLYAEKHEAVKRDLGGLMEKYWQQEWLYHVFPYAIKGSLMHNYFAFLIAYEVAQLYVYGVYDVDKASGREWIMEMLGFFSKIFDHRNLFLDTLVKETAVFESEPLKFMQVLLRI